LARAVCQESIGYWWGVSPPTVVKWRKALGISRMSNPGSRILIEVALSRARDERERGGPTPEYRQKQREHMLRRRLWELAPRVTRGKEWTAQERMLLGTMTDGEVARRTGHPLKSVRDLRQKLRIPRYRSGSVEK
jgi:hypothetical protein